MERNCHSEYLHKYIYTVESIHKKSVKVVFKTCCSYSLDMNQFKLINRKYTRKAPGRISSSIKLQTVVSGLQFTQKQIQSDAVSSIVNFEKSEVVFVHAATFC